MKEELLQFEGLVIEILPDARYRVRLDVGHAVVAYTAGKMKRNRILGTSWRRESPQDDLDETKESRICQILPTSEPTKAFLRDRAFLTRALTKTISFSSSPTRRQRGRSKDASRRTARTAMRLEAEAVPRVSRQSHPPG